jgi:hypothetical protein
MAGSRSSALDVQRHPPVGLRAVEGVGPLSRNCGMVRDDEDGEAHGVIPARQPESLQSR